MTSVDSWQSLYTLRGIRSDVRLGHAGARRRRQTLARVCFHASCRLSPPPPSLHAVNSHLHRWPAIAKLAVTLCMICPGPAMNTADRCRPSWRWTGRAHTCALVTSMTAYHKPHPCCYAAPHAWTVNLRSWHIWPAFQGIYNMRCHTLISWPPCLAPARYGRVPAITEPMYACCKTLHLI